MLPLLVLHFISSYITTWSINDREHCAKDNFIVYRDVRNLNSDNVLIFRTD